MDILTIILFFVYTFGLGYSVFLVFRIKKIEAFFERFVIMLGLGLATLVFVGLLLNMLHIMIDWKVILVVSLLGPLYSLFKNRKLPKFTFSKKIKKSTIYSLLVLVLFAFTLLMHTNGAFSYPWLEDGDPWHHALGAKYVDVEKTTLHGKLL